MEHTEQSKKSTEVSIPALVDREIPPGLMEHTEQSKKSTEVSIHNFLYYGSCDLNNLIHSFLTYSLISHLFTHFSFKGICYTVELIIKLKRFTPIEIGAEHSLCSMFWSQPVY
jgi:hypothetical protein